MCLGKWVPSRARVAYHAVEELPRIFLAKIKAKQSVEEAFNGSFDNISSMDNFSEVGCTAFSFFIKGNMMWVANAGDSRMIEIRQKSIRQITYDHRIDNPVERQRLISKGAIIRGSYIYVLNERKCLKSIIPTRTLGDHIFKEAGIISKPEIFKRKIFGMGTALVAGTNGFWDEVSNEQAADIVRKAKTAKKAAKELLRKIYESDCDDLDNITFMVIRP